MRRQWSNTRGLRSPRALAALAWLGLSGLAFSATAQESEASAEPANGNLSGIEIEVSGEARRTLLPMAVPDTLARGGADPELARQVAQTLRRNLDLSGYFRVLPVDSFYFDTHTEGLAAADISFSNWMNVGAQGLIKSSVRAEGDQIALDLRLFSVDQGRQVSLSWSATTVSPDEVQAQVNAFINAVIAHYTGEPGFFGSRIAYARRDRSGAKHVYVMNIDGSGVQRITRNNAINLLPSFGPGGAVYYTSYQDQNPDLWVWRNGRVSKLSSRSGQNSGAAYCGGKLALTLSLGGDNTDVYLINPDDGAVVQRLTDHWAIDVSPTWSPDCSRIAFVSGRSGGAHIYLMNADGSEQRRLTFQGTYNTTPEWSPRGDRIVFSGRDERNRYDIFAVDLQGNIERLTQDQGNNFEPSYSPDGRYILFTSDRGGRGKRLWLMSADGMVQKLLTEEGSGYEEAAWER
ncbi:translocation protein TolB [Lujinxingia litoralis]|uniref:Translocation protein TolB n=1 Tax=Lujinxingia litoralis TaxID=2211119 RepID=A0A328CAQ7_9DELT|nr:DPP IV N-terminal domain-containing protein [Lujinxingia litoralis]RAL25232.1 translocation protein TolB [Lujinxingia litoralis]